jgi:hypothetical protein
LAAPGDAHHPDTILRYAAFSAGPAGEVLDASALTGAETLTIAAGAGHPENGQASNCSRSAAATPLKPQSLTSITEPGWRRRSR